MKIYIEAITNTIKEIKENMYKKLTKQKNTRKEKNAPTVN